MEAHSEEEYEQHVRPFRGREWPGALLRFSVYDDETPRESPNNVSTQQDGEDVLMDDLHSLEGSRRRSRRHEHHRHGHHHGHHRDHHRRSDLPQWSRPRSAFLAPPPPPLPPPPPPPPLPLPPPPLFPHFFGVPSPPPPPSFHGSPIIVPPLPHLTPHVVHPAPPLPSLPSVQPLSQNHIRQQSPPPTVDATESPVQRLFRRRGLRSVASAPLLGPPLPVPPPPPPPPPRPVSLYGERDFVDSPPMMPSRRAVTISNEVDEFYDAAEVRACVDTIDAKGKQRDACCDVERAKQETSDLIRAFKVDIDRILSQSLGMEPADVWGITSTERRSNSATPQLSFNSERTITIQSQPTEAARSAESPSPAEPVIHTGVDCDICREIIVGVRHKCLDCPGLASPLSVLGFTDSLYVDFDLCSSCLAVQPQNTGSHSRSHALFDIEEPGGVWVHTFFSGEGTPEVPEPAGTNQGPTEPPNTGSPVSDAQGERTAPVAEAAVHYTTCNFCDTAIKGDRFVSIIHTL